MYTALIKNGITKMDPALTKRGHAMVNHKGNSVFGLLHIKWHNWTFSGEYDKLYHILTEIQTSKRCKILI